MATSNSFNPQFLSSKHQDFIHDIVFDFYGRRVATCSGDHIVQVWALNDDGEWNSSERSMWKAPSSITSLSFAHPEFGQLLAACGSDGICYILEEREEEVGNQNPNNPPGSTKWVKRKDIVDASRKSLSCVKFAPRHLGLQLATGSADGVVRIYEAMDIMNLEWSLKKSIPKVDSSESVGITCLDWCTGRFDPPTLVVGTGSGFVGVYRYFKANRDWLLHIPLERHALQSSGRRGVLDVAWSPNVGKSYHLIASCGRDGVVRVHKLKKSGAGSKPEHGERESSATKTSGSLEYESPPCQLETEPGSEVWRCAWNVTGSVLATSGEHNVQLWKSDFRGSWKCTSRTSRTNAN